MPPHLAMYIKSTALVEMTEANRTRLNGIYIILYDIWICRTTLVYVSLYSPIVYNTTICHRTAHTLFWSHSFTLRTDRTERYVKIGMCKSSSIPCGPFMERRMSNSSIYRTCSIRKDHWTQYSTRIQHTCNAWLDWFYYYAEQMSQWTRKVFGTSSN